MGNNTWRMGVEKLENKIWCRFLVQFLVRWEKGRLTAGHIHLALHTSPCCSQWRILLATPWSLPVTQSHGTCFLAVIIADVSQSCRHLGPRKRWSTTKKDKKWCLFHLPTNVTLLYNKYQKESQKNLMESHIISQYIVVAEIWDTAFPSPEPHAHFSEMLVECECGQPHPAWKPGIG